MHETSDFLLYNNLFIYQVLCTLISRRCSRNSFLLPLRQSRYSFKWKGRFSADAKPVLVRQVERRHKAGFGAAGLGTAQSWFWGRHKAGFGAVGLGWHKAGFGAGTKLVLERLVSDRPKNGFGAGTESVLERLVSGRHKYIYKEYIYTKKIYIYLYTQSILVFHTMQVLYWPVLEQIQFCIFDRRCKTSLKT